MPSLVLPERRFLFKDDAPGRRKASGELKCGGEPYYATAYYGDVELRVGHM